MNLKSYRRIKYLCDLDIDGRALIPILLPEIRKIVPAYSSSFLWLDKTYKFVNIFDESPDFQSIAENYVNNYLDNRDREARHSLSEWLKTGSVANMATTEDLAHRKFYHSDFYREILKPLGYHHSLYFGTKLGLAPIGILALHRKSGQKKFSQREKNFLKELTTIIPHTLTRSEYCNKTLPGECEAGLIIFDEHGLPCNISPQGRKLLFLATHSDIKKGKIIHAGDRLKIPDEIIALVRNLYGIYHEKMPANRSLSWIKSNPWGCFLFKINWLQRPLRGNKGQIAVTVQHQEPALYCIFRRCEKLGLTTRQIEVTTELLKGASYETVARKLYISTYTVADHVKKIYEKLSINNKGELLLSVLTTDRKQ